MNRLLMIDNYDSFTYNLVQAFQVLDTEVVVHRNDQIEVRPCARLDSPGDFTRSWKSADAGISMDVMSVCMGRFHLGRLFGASVLAQLLGGVVARQVDAWKVVSRSSRQ